jgi:ABC-2 type transport system ATP-binding protein
VKKQLTLQLQKPLTHIPEGLEHFSLELADHGNSLVYSFNAQDEQTGMSTLLRTLAERGIDFKNLHSSESSLEDIFVDLVARQ